MAALKHERWGVVEMNAERLAKRLSGRASQAMLRTLVLMGKTAPALGGFSGEWYVVTRPVESLSSTITLLTSSEGKK